MQWPGATKSYHIAAKSRSHGLAEEGRKETGQPVNHREIQNGAACLAARAAPQPCAQCGVGAHVKDLPVSVTWSQFAFSYTLYVS